MTVFSIMYEAVSAFVSHKKCMSWHWRVTGCAGGEEVGGGGFGVSKIDWLWSLREGPCGRGMWFFKFELAWQWGGGLGCLLWNVWHTARQLAIHKVTSCTPGARVRLTHPRVRVKSTHLRGMVRMTYSWAMFSLIQSRAMDGPFEPILNHGQVDPT